MLVAFLRAVNVGGRTVRVRTLADDLGLVNVGAAGTFVAPRGSDARALARRIRGKLPFETDVIVRSGDEIMRLLRAEPFGRVAPGDGVKRSVTILAATPARTPPLPLDVPDGAWQVRVTGLVGRYALSLRRRLGPRLIYPNEVVEKRLGVAATTRGWETVQAIGRILEGSP